MIVGDGLIATALKNSFLDKENRVFFASGVSNSLCESSLEFEREIDLLGSIISKNLGSKKFIYFSTCSVYDETKKLSPYVLHKLKIEKEVLRLEGGLVIRLPQVVGNSSNPNTLTNYFYNCIKKNNLIKVFKNAQRNLIDIDDTIKILGLAINHNLAVNILNIANPINYYPIEIIQSFEKVLNKRAEYELIDEGSPLLIDVSAIQELVPLCKVDFGKKYLEKMISKYYGVKN